MNKTHIHSFLLSLTALCLGAFVSSAQAVKSISVSNTQSYTDHVSLAEDSRDMDVMIKFIFDENKNVLTVSLLSYRRLFVFQDATRYKSVITCKRLHPDRLPYVAEAEKGARFTLSPSLKKSIPRPRSEYIFNRWISYEGLQPSPTAYKMVNDFIEQPFDIQGKRNIVTVTLRDVYLLDAQENNPDHYIISRGRDLNLKYQINIVRNPCLGRDDDIEAARKLTDEVMNAYQGFHQAYASGEVADNEALKTFEQTRTVLLTRYPVKQEGDPCPDLNALVQQYNQYVDSIGRLSCKIVTPGEASWDDGKPLDIKLLYTQTRQLDKAVARWLVSKDPVERKDLVSQCQDIIKDVGVMIRQHKVSTPEEQKAVQAYNQAEQYFRKTCNPK